MRTRTPRTGGALRRATGVVVLVLGVVVLLAACTSGRRVGPPPEPTTSLPAQPSPTPHATAGRPTRIQVAAIDVDAPVVPVGLLPDGTMQTPDRGRAGWYQPGPRPGAPGAAVVVAHVDSSAGPDVFHRLADLRPGDRIEVTDAAGRRHAFGVTHRDQVPKDRLPTDRIWDDPSHAGLRLITCGGAFDTATGHYRDNVVVWAREITGS